MALVYSLFTEVKDCDFKMINGLISKFETNFSENNSGLILLRALSFMILAQQDTIKNYFVPEIEKDKEFWLSLRNTFVLELFTKQLLFSRIEEKKEVESVLEDKS